MRPVHTANRTPSLLAATALLGCGSSCSAQGEYSVFVLSNPVSSYWTRASGLAGRIATGYRADSYWYNECDPLVWPDLLSDPVALPTPEARGGFTSSISADGTVVGGWFHRSLSDTGFACLWKFGETGWQQVELHPSNTQQQYGWSQVWAMSRDGAWQGGFATRQNRSHAAVWNGSEGTFRDLHPSWYEQSFVSGVSDDAAIMVGTVWDSSNGRAALWHANGRVRLLHPPGSVSSFLHGVSANGGRKVGFVNNGSGYVRAALWTSLSSRFIDLTPSGSEAECLAISPNGEFQVGVIHRGTTYPCLWRGSPASFEDLSRALPPGWTGRAVGVTDSGDVLGTAGKYPYVSERVVYWRRAAWLRITDLALADLQNSANWKAFNASGDYLAWQDPALLQGQAIRVSWGSFNDMTRIPGGVPDGQCVAFVRRLSDAPQASKWRPAAKLVEGGKVRDNLMPGDVVATFTNGRYDSTHTAVVMRIIDDQHVEVADQNFISGRDSARAIGRHQSIRIGGTGASDADRYWLVVRPSTVK